jgi:hypothetical protein
MANPRDLEGWVDDYGRSPDEVIGDHKDFVNKFGGMKSNSPDEWSIDIPTAVDAWLLKEFRAWARSDASPLTSTMIWDVDIRRFWERHHQAVYELTVNVDTDPDPAKWGKVRVDVSPNCGPKGEPTSFVFRALTHSEDGWTIVHNNFGILLKSQGPRTTFKIAGNASPKCVGGGPAVTAALNALTYVAAPIKKVGE